MTSDKLLTEVERQKKYLGKLPRDFKFPLFNSKTALESQRRNGYRNSASAAREIVDNAIEAGATQVHVVFERATGQRRAHQRADSVSAVAFIDDGSGMLPDMARYALSWGGGTHFEDSDFIGKFGFGLPNASINQTRRVAVYTKVKGAKKVTKAWLDANEIPDHGMQTIPEPIEVAELPPFVERYMKDNGLKFEHGTVVVWEQPDRLSYRVAASLREHLIDDFGVVYRYLLEKVKLVVEPTEVLSVDPLFLDPRGRYHVPEAEGGAIVQLDRTIPVKYFRDPDTGGVHLAKVEDAAELDPKDEMLVAVGSIRIRLARFPKGLAVHAKKVETDANRRFEIRKSRRGISFVRAGREIETVDAFPRSLRDKASGLGDWPLLQGYAYHFGCEVSFEPALDEVFGITNDKQTVRPIEDFWRLLAVEEIDRLLHAEIRWQATNREKKPTAAPSPTPTPAEVAAATADSVVGRKPVVPDHEKPRVRENLEKAAQAKVGVTAKSIDEARAALEAEAKRRPYKLDYFEDASAPFYEPVWGAANQIVIRVNRAHPFYQTLYGELLNLVGGVMAKEAVDVLLIALGKAELTTDDETTKLWYENQRKAVWSPFLANALKILAQTVRPTNVEEGDTEPQVQMDLGPKAQA